jgi:hypothetical protein
MGLKGCQIICLLRVPTGLGPTHPYLSCQNEQGHRGAQGPNRLSPETWDSLLKSLSITFSASVNPCRIHFSLFFSFRSKSLWIYRVHHILIDRETTPRRPVSVLS